MGNGDQSFSTHKTSPDAGGKKKVHKAKVKKAALAQTPSSGVTNAKSTGGGGSPSTGKAAAKKLVAKMQKDGLKVPNDLLKMAGESQPLVAPPPAAGAGVAAQPKLAAAGKGAAPAPNAVATPGSGLSLKVRKTVARL